MLPARPGPLARVVDAAVVPSLFAVYQVSVCRHPIAQFVAIAGRRLLSRRDVGIPDAALTRRRHVTRRNVVGVPAGRAAGHKHAGASAQRQQQRHQDPNRVSCLVSCFHVATPSRPERLRVHHTDYVRTEAGLILRRTSTFGTVVTCCAAISCWRVVVLAFFGGLCRSGGPDYVKDRSDQVLGSIHVRFSGKDAF